MKSLWKALSLLLLLHALALGGFAGWLKSTGRLSRERLHHTKDLFTLTVAQEKQQQEEANKLAEVTRQNALEASRLESISENGSLSLEQRLKNDQQADDMATQRVERLQRDIADLRSQLTHAKDLLAKQKAELDAKEKEFKLAVSREKGERDDADFKQAVAMYEALKPKQTKEMFQALIKQGKSQAVLEYMAAMQLRKTAAVIKEFKTPDEITQATGLVQRLRERGIDLHDNRIPAVPPLDKPEYIKGTT